ncbi:MAG: penicillin-binding protein 1A, partial [Myxococcota bacterium]
MAEQQPGGLDQVEPKADDMRRRLWTALSWALRIGAGGAIMGTVLLVGIFAWYSRDLPGFETLADYSPLQSTRLVTAEGELVGELFIERRTVVPYEEMPELLTSAFIAAEDERFHEHVGLDYLGIVRAMLRNLQAGGVKEGGSTITQQVVKTFLLTPERSYSRKLREMILARRLERNLSKEEILYLYLNQIYFGHGRYGVQEASRFYFGKDVSEIGLEEAAMLAALPRAPNLYSPRRFPDRALMRRRYVLRRLAETGVIDAETAADAAESPIELAPLPRASVGATYVEEVRRMLEARLGSELLLGGVQEVEVAMDPLLQRAAEEALAESLRAVDKRQGWRGPLTTLDEEARQSVRARFEELVEIRRSRGHEELLLWDISEIGSWEREEGAPPPVDFVRPEDGLVVAGVVSKVEATEAEVDLGGAGARLLLGETRWARPFGPDEHTPAPRNMHGVMEEGDVVLVRLEDPGEPPEAGGERGATEAEDGLVFDAKLEQLPLVEGALVAVDPRNRDLVAMVGGFDPESSHFNRATQARRQPGSAFKPFVYGAAIDTRRYTAGSIVLDAPEMFRDPWTGQTWRPANYDGRY